MLNKKSLFLFFCFIYSLSLMSMQNEKPVELENKGSTCFMNSTLQCLYHSDDITNFLLQKDGTDYYTPNSVATEYIKFLKNYKKALGSTQHINPIDWCEKIWSLELEDIPKKEGADAQQFLSVTLGHLGLDKNISDINQNRITERLPYPLQQLPHDTLINAVGGIYKHYFGTNVNTVKNQPIVSLPITDLHQFDEELVEVTKPSLQQCLDDHFFQREEKIFHFPKYLMLHLMRFKGTINDTEKIKDAIPFTFDLDLKKYIDDNAPQGESSKYELYGFVCHVGGFHYISYVKVNGNWWRCDDTPISIKLISVDDVKKFIEQDQGTQYETPYVLFYRQKKPNEELKYEHFDFKLNDILEKMTQNIPNKLKLAMNNLANEISNLEKRIKLETESEESFQARKAEDKAKWTQKINILKTVIEQFEQKNKPSAHLLFTEFIINKNIDLNSLRRSVEIGLIDINFLMGELAVYVQERAAIGKIAGQEMIEEQINVLKQLSLSLSSLSAISARA